MRILLVAVGRSRNGPERDLYRHYAARLKWPMTLKEVEVKERLPPESLKAREGELLLAALPEDAAAVALAESGALLDSASLARRLGQWRDRGTGTVAFLIGGADGLDETVARRADLVLSLGRVTWPHLLVRGLLAEQLYRAQQILAGHPYHRG
ncbi:MAG TPA: 23S rRNA (pseudouridine(1915)-N(3))-methyltransferase RlmH [Alphaproteobacteria bacterium]|nr:23S rRNA (pseudouridine(1915)-N(3))-methyltransferase RlmH [Alphaproteobacteria bacterium]